jgi:peptidoglycan/LPS O-acetylase OafA/YrhL
VLKNQNIERLRIFASYGIICFHSQTGLLKTIGYIGLPVFVMITFAYGVIKCRRQAITDSPLHPFKNYIVSKIERLLLPYLFWVFIYAVWGGLRALSSLGEIVNVPVTILIPLYGTSIHLWYLPFVFLALVSVSLLRVNFPSNNLRDLLSYSVAALITGLLPAFFPNTNQLSLPIPQILFALPALFIGLIISDDLEIKKQVKYGVSLAIIITTGIARVILNNDHSFLFLFFSSFLLVAIAQNATGKPDKITVNLSSLTFGIYLVHPIIIAIVSNLLGYHNCQGLTPLHSLMIFVLSACCIYYAKKTVIRRVV